MPRIIDDDARTPILQDMSDTENFDTRKTSVPTVDNELQEVLTGCGATACCNPSATVHRFIALILMCLVGFGEYISSITFINHSKKKCKIKEAEDDFYHFK